MFTNMQSCEQPCLGSREQRPFLTQSSEKGEYIISAGRGAEPWDETD